MCSAGAERHQDQETSRSRDIITKAAGVSLREDWQGRQEERAGDSMTNSIYTAVIFQQISNDQESHQGNAATVVGLSFDFLKVSG